MKKLLVAITAAGLAAALTPVLAENASTTQSKAPANESASSGQTTASKQPALRQLLEPNGPFGL